MSETIYNDIIKIYLKTRSVAETAEILGVSKVKVRRVLITEGLWESAQSRKVLQLFNEGLSTEEIAEKLSITPHAVSAYLPYNKGSYNDIYKSKGAKRVVTYRKRNKKAKKDMPKANLDAEKKMIRIDSPGKKENRPADIPKEKQGEIGKSMGDLEKDDITDKVYELHIELVEKSCGEEDYSLFDLNKDELELLKSAGGSSGVICRDVLVPSDMDLHSLHFAIQKLFGWQNSHLHNYLLPNRLFYGLAGDTFEGIMPYLGILFRFPDGDIYDIYWDDDYSEEKSISSWFKEKYSAPYMDFGAGNSFIDSQRHLKELLTDCMKKDIDIRSMRLDSGDCFAFFEQDLNFIKESLKIKDIFLLEEMTMEETKKALNKSRENANTRLRELKDEGVLKYVEGKLFDLHEYRQAYSAAESGQYDHDAFPGDPKIYKARYYERIQQIIKDIWPFVQFSEPAIKPFTNEMFYSYDYGDGWFLRICCTGIYEKGDERFIEKVFKGHPLCLAADGLRLMDDVGGFYGFLEFLSTVTGDDYEEAQEMLNWASMMGWSGRKISPKQML